MITIVLTTLESQVMAETLCRAIVAAGAEMKMTDKENDAQTYRDIKNDFDVLCSLHARVCPPATRSGESMDGISDLERWRRRNSDALAAVPYDAQRAEGVNPVAELIDIDPRALDPHCVHGISAKDFCPDCEGDSLGTKTENHTSD